MERLGTDLRHRADDSFGQVRAGTDDGAVADLGALDQRVAVHLDVVVQVRLGDHNAGSDLAVPPDPHGRPDRHHPLRQLLGKRLARLRVTHLERLGRDPDIALGVERGAHQPDHRLEVAVENVHHRVHVVLHVPQVSDPAHRVSEHRISALHQPREQVLPEVQPPPAHLGDLMVAGDSAQRVDVDHVEPGVGQQRQAFELFLVPRPEVLLDQGQRGLLDEGEHLRFRVGEHYAVFLGDVGRSARHRGDGYDGALVPVGLDHRLEVEVDQGIRREDQRCPAELPVIQHPQRRVGAAGG